MISLQKSWKNCLNKHKLSIDTEKPPYYMAYMDSTTPDLCTRVQAIQLLYGMPQQPAQVLDFLISSKAIALTSEMLDKKLVPSVYHLRVIITRIRNTMIEKGSPVTIRAHYRIGYHMPDDEKDAITQKIVAFQKTGER